jgi:diguanylate cyclase (GGDEF)-like protein
MTAAPPASTPPPGLVPAAPRRAREEPRALVLFLFAALLALAAFSAGLAAAVGAASPTAAFAVAVLALLLVVGRDAVRLSRESREARARLAEAAVEDPVTGLPAKRLAVARLAEEVERAHRHGRPFTLLRLDLDGLGVVVERHGAAAARELLRSVGEAVRGRCRRSDLVARWDESGFAVLLPETGGGGGRTIAARLREAVATRRNAVDDAVFAVSLSVGVASIAEAAPIPPGGTAPGPGAEALALAADGAMRQAREAGGNAVVVA